MKIINTRNELLEVLTVCRLKSTTVGFVPTMGALHAGHLSLIAASKSDNEITVCSIFVNPTQFTNSADLAAYPRPVESDIRILTNSGVDLLFMPEPSEMYLHNEYWHIDLGTIDSVLEGKFRPGHFQGVTQIVHKFFTLIKPDKAYFGIKDYQQLLVITKMVQLMNLPVKIVCCPIIREPDGLAMSSRNIHLTPEYRCAALLLSKTLFTAASEYSNYSAAETVQHALITLSENELLKVEYFCIVDSQTLKPVVNWIDSSGIIALLAVNAGQTRLIDNQYLKQQEFYS